ncbi:type IV toxin-antitoxin system AbiEi family antitoxin domain-containing protein [Thiobacillus denitrificans]|uniref:type IV toxin-antitoxin system AbiEi family antitoxin domain-containing protein n=1 Tax=Thiobacillus denitrificans TaxID=36861 RepID=UPI0012F97E0F|nr:type IV toxin-antitoxin system AbiEi family antitoxin [Thiobacillus denitrificans]
MQLLQTWMTALSPLSAVLDSAEREGRLNVHAADLLAALPGTSPGALRQALYRQQAQGRIVHLSRGSGHWLIVPLQFASAGAPPLETWLDHYLSKTLHAPYYVGLLSAAEAYGASPYAVMVTQVMAAKSRRPVTVGRHELVFHTRARIQQMPTRWHETADGRFKVSTPELTALELVQRDAQVGGIARVQEVLHALYEACSLEGLQEALDAAQEVPAAQRLGTLFSLQGRAELTQGVQHWLQGRKMRAIPLESGSDIGADWRLDDVFKVWLPPSIERSNA